MLDPKKDRASLGMIIWRASRSDFSMCNVHPRDLYESRVVNHVDVVYHDEASEGMIYNGNPLGRQRTFYFGLLRVHSM